eukprot:CAMPEP_0206219614 /NCGR_PEP_ID=MMETSP0047_2-20121206/4408_1 /ASSEMBLY_ACC=CAM_ASM_000192 /TAXON_ID=195065 /ORGANISM="Chroomonas mesostigmatica_cf, Strain CCMP1168" /LENGTH=451 /DNA_ID=CAMNT_0053642159 /DNA_START=56 /DNA_END=1408 /DNA_ORIENTATION=-
MACIGADTAISPVARIDHGGEAPCSLVLDSQDEGGLMVCATRDTLSIWGGIEGAVEGPELLHKHTLSEGSKAQISHAALRGEIVLAAGKTMSGKRKKACRGFLTSINPPTFAVVGRFCSSGRACKGQSLAHVELPLCMAEWASIGGVCLIDSSKGLCILAANEAGEIVRILLDPDTIPVLRGNAKGGGGGGGSRASAGQAASGAGGSAGPPVIGGSVAPLRCNTLPSAAGYGAMVGLCVPRGRDSLVVGAYHLGIAVWDHVSGVLLSCTSVDAIVPHASQKITGLCCANGGGRIVACFDASRARGGARVRSTVGTQASQQSDDSSSQRLLSSGQHVQGRTGHALCDSFSISEQGVVCLERGFVPFEMCGSEEGEERVYSPVFGKGVCVGCDGRHVVAGCLGGGAYVWDIANSRLVAAIRQPDGRPTAACVAIRGPSPVVVLGWGDGSTDIW